MDLIAVRQRIRNYASEAGKNWYKITNASGSGPTRVSIYGEIGFYGVSAQDMCDQLDSVDGPIEIFINSVGGEIFEGLAIYNYLLRRQPSMFVDGLAASAASFIAQAAAPGKLGIAKTGRMMIHNGQALAAGDARELREMAELLDKETRNIATIYADRTGEPADHWLEMMDKTSWLDAPEAVGCGLADFMYDPRVGPSAVLGTTATLKNAATVPYVGRSETRHVPTTTTHSHDHGAHGHPNHDDGIHSHSHSHANDSDHNHDHSQMHDDDDGDEGGSYYNLYQPGMSFDAHIDNSSFDNTAWSGGAAMKAAGGSASPAKAFAAICAGRRDGPADERGSWALPHHKHPGSPPNKNGVNNALARLASTEGLTNKEAAEAHLKAHQAAWASEPENSVDGFTDDDARTFANILKGA